MTANTLSGPATQKLLQRAYYDFKVVAYGRLAKVSVAQLYRLRQSRRYRERRIIYQPTRPVQVSIGERRPETNGQPGYLRVDTVHQGDLGMELKRYLTLTRSTKLRNGRSVGAVAQISEAYLIPVLEAMLAQFPFAFAISTLTTAVNSSTTRLRNC